MVFSQKKILNNSRDNHIFLPLTPATCNQGLNTKLPNKTALFAGLLLLSPQRELTADIWKKRKELFSYQQHGFTETNPPHCS